jgi:hypothetical protein
MDVLRTGVPDVATAAFVASPPSHLVVVVVRVRGIALRPTTPPLEDFAAVVVALASFIPRSSPRIVARCIIETEQIGSKRSVPIRGTGLPSASSCGAPSGGWIVIFFVRVMTSPIFFSI